MTLEQESVRLYGAGATEPTAPTAIVRRLPERATGPWVQHPEDRGEVIEPDESPSSVTKASKVIALASLFVAIEGFLDRNYPGLTLSDLRALAASESAPHGTSCPGTGCE